MRTCFILAAMCALAVHVQTASSNIIWMTGTSRVWAAGHLQSGGSLEVLTASDQNVPWEPYWYARGDFSSSVQGSWFPIVSWTSYSAHGAALSQGQPQSVGADLTLDFTFDAPGFVSLSTSGRYAIAGIDGFGSVTGDHSISGWLGAGSYHLYATARAGSDVAPTSEAASFAFTIPSPGPLSLALLGGGLLYPRRRRAAQ